MTLKGMLIRLFDIYTYMYKRKFRHGYNLNLFFINKSWTYFENQIKNCFSCNIDNKFHLILVFDRI